MSLDLIEAILKRNKMLFDRTYSKGILGISKVKNMSYEDIWQTVVSSSAYDFRLSDNSLLSFNPSQYGESQPRFAYYSSPYLFPSYKDYLIGRGVAETQRDVYFLGSSFLEDYAEELIGAPVNPHPVILRFDRQVKDYVPGRHPEYHIHFGLDNEIRVGCSQTMTPVEFTYFILRQVYPYAWEVYLSKHKDYIKSRINKSRGLSSKNFGDLDTFELTLDYISFEP